MTLHKCQDSLGSDSDNRPDLASSVQCQVWRVLQVLARRSVELLCSVIDYGAGWFDLNRAFSQQRAMNPPGKSPPMCSEF